MKKLVLVPVLGLICQLSFSQTYESGKPKAWVNLVGEKFTGSDKDLIGFKILKPDTTCDYLTRRCAVTWETSTERLPDQELKSYTIFFQVSDRKGTVVLEKHYKWDKDIRETKGEYVGRYKKFVEWPGITLDYSTVHYWAQDIRWISKKSLQRKHDGPKAFKLEDQLNNLKNKRQ